jgi:hypothetical protein
MLIQARIESRKNMQNEVCGDIYIIQLGDSVGFYGSDESITLRLEMLSGY